jgi:hypothetical protein
VRAAIVNYEENDVRPVVVLDLERHRTGDELPGVGLASSRRMVSAGTC